jgi:hypothetical protein
MRGGADDFNDFKSFDARINKLAYCAVSIITESPQKVLYLTKFPPASGTFAPNKKETKNDDDLNLGSTRDEKFRFDFDFDFGKATEEEVEKLKKMYKDFWSSPNSKQENGKWKGGIWGEENLPLTSTSWLAGAFLDNKLKITPIKKGSIPYGKDFGDNATINEGTEDHVWSVKVSVGDGTKEYNAYLTENIMPQKATDILVFMQINGVLQIQMLKRGNARNVDMKERYIPGAGEHLEPGKDTQKNKKKPDIAFWRSLREEMGITPRVLEDANAFSTKIEVINASHNKTDNIYDSEGRDPRYWTFEIEGNVCGIKRGSSSEVYALYIHSDKPIDSIAKDRHEVQYQKWFPVDEVLTWEEDKFMIEDHKDMIIDAKRLIDNKDSDKGEPLNMDFAAFTDAEIKGYQGILETLSISEEEFNKDYLLNEKKIT